MLAPGMRGRRRELVQARAELRAYGDFELLRTGGGDDLVHLAERLVS
jgi:hypothetical protein